MHKEKSMSDGVEEYRGKEIVVRFDGRKCIHSRNCVLGRPDVFVPNAPGPWIKPDNAAAETIAAIALSCPSGAIAYERLHGGPRETAPPVNVVRIRENGPLAFHAELAIEGEEPAFRATLCRCGASRRKPHCDGSHAAAQFAATGEPAMQESSPLASTRNRQFHRATVEPKVGCPIRLAAPPASSPAPSLPPRNRSVCGCRRRMVCSPSRRSGRGTLR